MGPSPKMGMLSPVLVAYHAILLLHPSVVPTVTASEVVRAAGLNVEVYDGYFDDNFDFFKSAKKMNSNYDVAKYFNSQSPATSMYYPNIPNDYFHGDKFSVSWEGYVTPSISGAWSFKTISDDASWVWIGNKDESLTSLKSRRSKYNEVVDNGGEHGQQERSGSKVMSAFSSYPILVYFGDYKQDAYMAMYMTPPGGSSSYRGSKLFSTVPNYFPVPTAAPVPAPSAAPVPVPTAAPVPAPTADPTACVAVKGASIGWTGADSRTCEVKTYEECCAICEFYFKAKPYPCQGWVLYPDGCCYQKYNTGNGVALNSTLCGADPDTACPGQFAGVYNYLPSAQPTPEPTPEPVPEPTFGELVCNAVAGADIGDTGAEDWVCGVKDYEQCCDICKSEFKRSPYACLGWVYYPEDGCCYQKYETGKGVELKEENCGHECPGQFAGVWPALPTETPTPQPTVQPTEEPSAQPTKMPVPKPTGQPTPLPTQDPTHIPTPLPSAQPTSLPTPGPTHLPTSEPTSKPTPEPTSQPTHKPTPEPTAEPTSQPTHVPTHCNELHKLSTEVSMDMAVMEVSQSTRRLHTARAEAIVKIVKAAKNDGFAALRGGDDANTKLMMNFISELTLQPASKPNNIKALAEEAFEAALVVLEEAKKWPASADGFMVEYTTFAQSKPTASELAVEKARRVEVATKFPGIMDWWLAETNEA
jgi:hypothetical protein